MLEWFLDDQRPRAWRQWPEVVWRDARTPRFLGDLPHGWVGSDYLRSVLDMLAYPDEAREALVIGEGVPPEWLEGEGVRVRNLPTPWGDATFTLRREGDAVVADIRGPVPAPPGGIVVRVPCAQDRIIVHETPARVASSCRGAEVPAG